MPVHPSRRRRPVIDPAELGQVLRVLRRRSGMTLDEASDALGLSRASLVRAERDGERHFKSAVRAIDGYARLHAEDEGRPAWQVETKVHLPPRMHDVLDETREPQRARVRSVVARVFHDAELDQPLYDRVEFDHGPSRVLVLLDGPLVYRATSEQHRGFRIPMPRRPDESVEDYLNRVRMSILKRNADAQT